MLEAELERFRRDHPRCAALHARARDSLFAGVPMPWMAMWAGGHPVAFAEASGSGREWNVTQLHLHALTAACSSPRSTTWR